MIARRSENERSCRIAPPNFDKRSRDIKRSSGEQGIKRGVFPFFISVLMERESSNLEKREIARGQTIKKSCGGALKAERSRKSARDGSDGGRIRARSFSNFIFLIAEGARFSRRRDSEKESRTPRREQRESEEKSRRERGSLLMLPMPLA